MPEEQPSVDTEAYSRWKGWDATSAFGTPGRGDAAHYARELREATHGTRAIADVLEIGFGHGEFLFYCRSRGWNVRGTELSPEQVAAGTDAGFEVFLADHVSQFEDGSFDLIAAFDVLEHIPPAEAVEFLSTLALKLRAGGTLLLRYPNGDTWLGNAFQNGDPTHVSAIGYHKLEYLAACANLDILMYRAPRRRGFSTSIVHGLHRLTAGAIIKLVAGLQKALYFPGTPLVLSSSNVVCLLSPKAGK